MKEKECGKRKESRCLDELSSLEEKSLPVAFNSGVCLLKCLFRFVAELFRVNLRPRSSQQNSTRPTKPHITTEDELNLPSTRLPLSTLSLQPS